MILSAPKLVLRVVFLEYLEHLVPLEFLVHTNWILVFLVNWKTSISFKP
jgi:hypothetical protein